MSDINAKKKVEARNNKHARVRAKISGTAARPRLSVFRSNNFIEGQIINDDKGETLVAVAERNLDSAKRTELKKGDDERSGKVAVAYAMGKSIAEKAKAAGIKTVVFDRGGYAYKGRVAAFAQGARDNGLEF